MALNGVGGALGGLGFPGLQPRAPRENEERRPVAAEPKAVPQQAPAKTSTEAVLSAEAPPGTDPAFWSVLTTEERMFFSRMQSLGPLTYGPSSSATKAPPLARGGRIDLKV